MVTEEEFEAMWIPLAIAIRDADVEGAVKVIKRHPDIVDLPQRSTTTWMQEAAARGDIHLAKAMLDAGCKLNVTNQEPDKSTPLETAIRENNVEMTRLFLERGADPNLGKPMVSAIGRTNVVGDEILKLLLRHGADVNRHYDSELPEYAFTVLDRAQTEEIRQVLLQHGAKTSAELCAEKGHSPANDSETTAVDVRQEIITHFEQSIVPASKKSLIQIVPTGVPIGIHFIPPKDNRKHLTLFTNGLSSEPMNAPVGAEEYRYAELFIELPGDWKIKEVKDMRWAWPLYWLRKMAQYPHNADTWLGGPVTLMANDDPPQPLWPGSKFTTLLLFAESSFQRSDGNTVQLYRLIPLYTSEREYELKHGLKRFMQALDKNEVPFIVDIDRKPFA